MRRQLSIAVAATIAAATVALPMGSAQASPIHRTTAKWYLALGDSLAAGYQPGTGDDKTGGYVGGALAMLKLRDRHVQLTNLACSGETTTTFVTGTRCTDQPSQQAAALSFLKAHAHQQGVITIDLGSNDIDSCVKGANIDLACVAAGLRSVATNLPPILQKLHAAAPKAKLVVLNYYNPFLAAYLLGAQGQAIAKQSESLATTFNGEIATAAATVGAPVADVARAFFSNADAPLLPTQYGRLPVNVAVICEWTWMCSKQNIHANDIGYAVMAWTLAPYLLR